MVLVVGTLFPAILLAGLLVRELVRENRDEVERRLLETARFEAAVVDDELFDIVQVLDTLGDLSGLANGDLAQFQQETGRLRHSQAAIDQVLLTGDDGRVLMSTVPETDAPSSVVEASNIHEALSTGKPAIGTLHKIEDAGGSRFVFPVSIPLMRDGKPGGVLSALVRPERLMNVLLDQRTPSDEWVRGFVDSAGTVVARSREAERFVGQPGTPEFLKRFGAVNEEVYQDVALDGRAVYGAYVRAPRSRWIAGVAVPTSVMQAAFRRSMLGFLGLTVALLGLGGVGAYGVARRISLDIVAAATAANALAQGKRPEAPDSVVLEVQQLSGALEHSATLLEEHERQRDEEVRRAEEARAKAEAADRAKDEFLAMLGHELRNPLAPALTALELMRLRGEGSSRHREVLERQVKHLARLVDDLLDVSRLRRGRIELRMENTELGDAIERAVEMSRPLVAERGHQLTVDVPHQGLLVRADATRLAQVFSNIVTNAAKYTDRQGHIAIRAYRESNVAVVRCEDDGIGIAPELLPHVFEPFAQGRRALDRKEGGLGLGLAVAKILVEAQGGTIHAESAGSGHGSTFTVRLPLAERDRLEHTPPVATTNEDGDGRRVLVVDDNRDAAEMLAETLRLRGFEVQMAYDGADALATFERFKPHVALLDIGLPVMSGFDVAKRIREIDSSGHVRLIALTGYGQQTDAAACYAAGFDLHVVKPIAAETLFEIVQRSGRWRQTRL
jgi:signal transduction histidine kinase/ActR/RegA family two-component response regulator